MHRADEAGLALSADGPVALAVAYELRASATGSEVSASVAVAPRGRLLAEATAAMLAAGALQLALGGSPRRPPRSMEYATGRRCGNPHSGCDASHPLIPARRAVH